MRPGAAALTTAAVAAVLLAAVLVAVALAGRPGETGLPTGSPGAAAGAGEGPAAGASAEDSERWAAARARMVEDQILARGVTDERVLAAMRAVPRHRFVPDAERRLAYSDQPLPIGWGQTISQPYVVALMCSLLDLDPDDRVLEIGTGSGYHAAVLSRLAGEVYSIEIVEPLGRRAGETLAALGYGNVRVRIGDGYEGWPEKAPFDAVVLTAAPPEVPRPLLEQLVAGGRLVVPVGGAWEQELQVITRTADGYRTEHVAPVRFVPMTGKAGG